MGDGSAVLLHAYFDESERKSGTFCVAGFAFTPFQAKSFARDWRRMLDRKGVSVFHATDLAAKRQEFRDFDSTDADRMMRRAVDIINNRSVSAAVVLCDRQEFEAVAPTWKRGFRNPYPMCCHLCMALLGRWMRASRRQGEIAYFFEAGNRYATEAQDLLSLAQTPAGIQAGLAEEYRYRSHAFLQKRDAEPLQAADLLAWEWGKYCDETVKQPIRPARRSIEALMRRHSSNFLERHLTGAPLRRYCETLKVLDLLPG